MKRYYKLAIALGIILLALSAQIVLAYIENEQQLLDCENAVLLATVEAIQK